MNHLGLRPALIGARWQNGRRSNDRLRLAVFSLRRTHSNALRALPPLSALRWVRDPPWLKPSPSTHSFVVPSGLLTMLGGCAAREMSNHALCEVHLAQPGANHHHVARTQRPLRSRLKQWREYATASSARDRCRDVPQRACRSPRRPGRSGRADAFGLPCVPDQARRRSAA